MGTCISVNPDQLKQNPETSESTINRNSADLNYPKVFANDRQLYLEILKHQRLMGRRIILSNNWHSTGRGYYHGEQPFRLLHKPTCRGYLYLPEHRICFFGPFVDGEPVLSSSSCKIIFSDGGTYEGSLTQDFQAEGSGTLKSSAFVYKGHFKENSFNGKGVLEQQGCSYRGNFKDGQIVEGTADTAEWLFEGKFVKGMMEGVGKYFWKNKGRYEGEFKCNMKHGKGKLFNTEGKLAKNVVYQNDRLLM